MATPGKTKSSKTTPKTSAAANPSKATAKERRAAAERRRRQQQQLIIAGGAVVLLVAVVLVIFVSTRPLEGFVPVGAADKYKAVVDNGFQGRTDEGYYFLGDPNAPVTMEMVSSFSCSACQAYHDSVFQSLQDKIAAGNLKFVYIPVTTYGSFQSDGMARGAFCAGEQGKFFEMSDVIFDWPGRYGSDSNNYRRLSDAAGQLGLDRSKFDACLTSSTTNELMDKAANLAKTRNVTATPTVYLDGSKIYPEMPDGSQGPDLGQLRGMIEAKVAQK